MRLLTHPARSAAAALAATALLGPVPTAGAEGAAARPVRASDERPAPPTWMGEHMQFRKGYGFEYRRALRMGETPLDVGVLGPVVRKKKSLGLTLEVRF